MEIELSVIYY